jgi:hypothetical protein
MYGEEKNILYHGPTRAAKAEQKSQQTNKLNKPTKEGPVSFVFFESSFTSFQKSAEATPL